MTQAEQCKAMLDAIPPRAVELARQINAAKEAVMQAVTTAMEAQQAVMDAVGDEFANLAIDYAEEHPAQGVDRGKSKQQRCEDILEWWLDDTDLADRTLAKLLAEGAPA